MAYLEKSTLLNWDAGMPICHLLEIIIFYGMGILPSLFYLFREVSQLIN